MARMLKSDSLGVGAHQVDDLRTDARNHGFTGVEFKQDPVTPEFYQCNVDASTKEFQRYLKHRGMADYNHSDCGYKLSSKELDDARRIAERVAKNR